MLASTDATLNTLLDTTIWLTAAATGRRPRLGPLRGGAGAGRLQHSEWAALLGRFAQSNGIEYDQMTRVRRLVEVYLRRLAETDPEAFVDTDDQLAFYLNAYNVIAVHQVLLHYPIHSIRDVPQAFFRPYPIGRRNLSLHTLHANVLRAFGDPRVHVAITPAARGAPTLSTAFVGAQLQSQLDATLRAFLSDPQHGATYDPRTNTLYLSALFRWYGGDFIRPGAMPRVSHLFNGWFYPSAVLSALRSFLPVDLIVAIETQTPTVRFLPFDWSLNQQPTVTSGRQILAR